MGKKTTFDVTKHLLVPKHVKLSDNEKIALLKKYKITLRELPRISMKDPAIINMKLSTNDVIKIIRLSNIAGESVFYRRVVK